MKETETNEFVQRQAAEVPFEEYEGEYPTRPRRRVVAVVATLVVVLVAVAVLFVSMNNRIDSLDQKITTQSQQIRQLHGRGRSGVVVVERCRGLPPDRRFPGGALHQAGQVGRRPPTRTADAIQPTA